MKVSAVPVACANSRNKQPKQKKINLVKVRFYRMICYLSYMSWLISIENGHKPFSKSRVSSDSKL